MDDSYLNRLSSEVLLIIGEMALGDGVLNVWQSTSGTELQLYPARLEHPFAPPNLCAEHRPTGQEAHPLGLIQCCRDLRALFFKVVYNGMRIILHIETWALNTDPIRKLAEQLGDAALAEIGYVTLMYLTTHEDMGRKIRLAYRELCKSLPVRVVAEVHFPAPEPYPSRNIHHRMLSLDGADLGRSCENAVNRFDCRGEVLDGTELEFHGRQVWPWLQTALRAEIQRGYLCTQGASEIFGEDDVALLWDEWR